MITTVSGQEPADSLLDKIKQVFAGQQGVFAMAFRNTQTGETLLVNGHETFHAASTMKTPVMIELFKQHRQKKIDLSDSIVIKNSFRSIVDSSVYSLDAGDDSQQELYKQTGTKTSIRSLLYQMIIRSSNLATNMLIELAGAKNVTRSMRELGADQIQVLRGVEDNKAYQQGLNNTTTAFDLMVIFDKMAKGEIIDKAACSDMIAILLDQQFNELIPARLPAGVRVAHKTGSITGVRHDSGIVFTADGNKYALVLLSKNLKDEKNAIDAMSTVSRMIYDYVMRQ